jgi:hypothetical protein
LRHPIPVARQLAPVAERAPGRLTFGVGIGGEDRHEVEMCRVGPKTRGRRMDECLRILRAVADGTPVTFEGEFFSLKDALIVPLIVAGRSDAAVSRAARLGDGWLAIWVSPRRFTAVRDRIARGRQRPAGTRVDSKHALNVWCGFAPHVRAHASGWPRRCRPSTNCDSSRSNVTRHTARPRTCRVPESYIDAGCSVFNVIPCAEDDESAITGVSELRTLLGRSRINGGDTDEGPALGRSGRDVTIHARHFEGPLAAERGAETGGLDAREIIAPAMLRRTPAPPLEAQFALKLCGADRLQL